MHLTNKKDLNVTVINSISCGVQDVLRSHLLHFIQTKEIKTARFLSWEATASHLGCLFVFMDVYIAIS